jgi:hypothetical protein
MPSACPFRTTGIITDQNAIFKENLGKMDKLSRIILVNEFSCAIPIVAAGFSLRT